jgi:serine/threonine-protein kinase HipA
MVFNIVARNQDDHVKNIAFLMNQQGEWSLAPAFDVTYSFNPSGAWTARHQMTLNGKRDGFTREDFEAAAKAALMKRGRAAKIIEEVQATVQRWPEFAAEARLDDEWRDKIQKTHRLSFPEK